MTKGTKAFRIIINVLVTLTMLVSTYFIFGLIYIGKTFVFTENYGIYVDGELITRSNKDDILDDGTVSGEGTSIFCSGAVINEGATVNAKIDALSGVHNKAEN